MNVIRFVITCTLLVAPADGAGCLVAPEPGDDTVIAREAEETMNGLTMNGLTAKELAWNLVLTDALNSDPDARMFFRYVVDCALPPGEAVVFPELAGQTSYTFSGGVGIAPSWGVDGGTCDSTCQEWVSACVLSRVNALGEHVSLSLRGDSAALAMSPTEPAAYAHREATYFGNVLVSPQKRYACRAETDDQALIGRVCGAGADTSACLVTVLGDCASRCRTTGNTDGFFAGCATPDDGTFVPAVTVFRR